MKKIEEYMKVGWIRKEYGVVDIFDENDKLRIAKYTGFTSYYDEKGNWHREDGPAREYLALPGFEPHIEWWFHGKLIPCKSQQEFERILRLKAFW